MTDESSKANSFEVEADLLGRFSQMASLLQVPILISGLSPGKQKEILCEIVKIGRERTKDEWDHYPSIDTDRCDCGGEIVYFEDGDARGDVGEGCEVLGLTWAPQKKMRHREAFPDA